MIEEQLISRGIKNPEVLKAMRKVPRHLFVPAELLEFAYDDTPLPIGYHQTISQPYVVAFMSEALDLNSESSVLEVGTGSGYQAAVLAELAGNVYTIEIVEALAQRARNVLLGLGYQNIYFKVGDGYEGWEENAPYDAVIATCAPSHIPQKLKDQVREGGKIILPVGEKEKQELWLLEKKNGIFLEKSVFPVKFVPMTNSEGFAY